MSGDFLNGPEKNKEVEMPEVVARCPHCNEPLGEDKTFCHKCGKYLGKKGGEYKPLNEKTAKIIRISIGVVAIIIFAIIYFAAIK